MKILILTAGLGRRMRPLTDDSHKTLLEVGPGQTILGRILTSLRHRGQTDIVIVTGYREAQIRAFVSENFADLNLTFVHNERYDETNNIHSMALAFQDVDFSDGLILIESDLIFDESVLDTLHACTHENVALLDRYQPGMDGTVVKLDARGKIVSVIPGSQQPEGFDFRDTFKTLNIYRFSGDFASGVFAPLLKFYSQTINDNCYYELILGMLIAMGHADIFGAIVPHGSWSEVDDPVDLHHARFMSAPVERRQLLDTAWGGYWGLDMTDFAFIRNMHFPPHQILAEVRMQLPELMSTYGSSQRILDRKMSWFLGVPEERLVAVNGASQFFPWAASYFSGRPTWVQKPTFGEWNRSFPDAMEYPDNGDGDLHLPADLAPGSVVVIVNPNNPTGTTASTRGIFDLCAAHPATHFLIDESFIQFSDQPSIVDLLERSALDNVLVVQSLSKVLGVPGLRIGFAYSTNVELLQTFRESLPIWNMNAIAEKFVELLLKTRTALDDSYEQTKLDRADLEKRLQDLPQVSRVWNSGADFILVELDATPAKSADMANRMLSDHRIYVKEVSRKLGGDQGFWRLAVRLPEEHERLVTAMAEVFSSTD